MDTNLDSNFIRINGSQRVYTVYSTKKMENEEKMKICKESIPEIPKIKCERFIYTIQISF